MIVCCKCGGDCGPGNGVSMCLGCNEMADMEVQDRSIQKDEAKKEAILAGLDKQDAAAVLALPLGKLTEEDLKPSERHDN